MNQLALQQPSQIKGHPFEDGTQEMLGILTHVELNYHEAVCIELALIGFAEMIREQKLPWQLKNYSLGHLAAQLRYLKAWLKKPYFKTQLRFDGKNSVLWPFTSSETVDWLLKVCDLCITEDAVLIASAEAGNCEHNDFAGMYLEDVSGHSLADYMSYSNFSAFQSYYNNIVENNQDYLVAKLLAIRSQGFPLFPDFSKIGYF